MKKPFKNTLQEDTYQFFELIADSFYSKEEDSANLFVDSLYIPNLTEFDQEIQLETDTFLNIDDPNHNLAYQCVSQYEAITITAFDPSLDSKTNLSRNSELKRILLGFEYDIIDVEWVYSKSLLEALSSNSKIPGFQAINRMKKKEFKNHLIHLGLRFNQNYITYSLPNRDYFLISTKPNDTFFKFGHLESFLFPMFGANQNIYYKIPSRDFIFTKIGRTLEKLTDYYPTEIRSLVMQANSVLEKPSPPSSASSSSSSGGGGGGSSFGYKTPRNQ